MSRQPKSILEPEGMEVARSLGATKTVAFIERTQCSDGEDDDDFGVVARVMGELDWEQFMELLKRTRDRNLAYEALDMIPREDKEVRWYLFPALLWEMRNEIKYPILANYWRWRRGEKSFREAFGELADELQKLRREGNIVWNLYRKVRHYSTWHFDYLVIFIGNGNDPDLIDQVLSHYGDQMTYQRGKWIERKRDLLRRTPEQIATDKAAKRRRSY